MPLPPGINSSFNARMSPHAHAVSQARIQAAAQQNILLKHVHAHVKGPSVPTNSMAIPMLACPHVPHLQSRYPCLLVRTCVCPPSTASNQKLRVLQRKKHIAGLSTSPWQYLTAGIPDPNRMCDIAPPTVPSARQSRRVQERRRMQEAMDTSVQQCVP